MLYSRAGDYPKGQSIIYAEAFSPNTPEGACPQCHGLGKMYEVTEKSMVPDDSLTIRERAIAAWPTAWGVKTCATFLSTMGYDVDVPWRELSKKDRDWILFTDETPMVPVYPGFTKAEVTQALKRKMTHRLYGHLYRCAALRIAYVCQYPKCAHEKKGSAVHDQYSARPCATANACARILSIKFSGLILLKFRGCL